MGWGGVADWDGLEEEIGMGWTGVGRVKRAIVVGLSGWRDKRKKAFGWRNVNGVERAIVVGLRGEVESTIMVEKCGCGGKGDRGRVERVKGRGGEDGAGEA